MLIQTGIVAVSTFVIFLLFWRFWFLRDPDRTIPEGDNIISPADGKVIAILPVHKESVDIPKGMFGKVETLAKDIKNAGYLISIFMSPLDVHVQRAPINGRISKVKHTNGRFLAADSLAALANENNETVIDDLESVKVIQIAGFLARRIECWVKAGDHVVKGDKIGRINLGSQVSLIVPKNIKLLVKEGERVRAGETILAEIGI